MGILSWPLMLVIVVSGLVPLAANALFAGPLRKAADAIQAHLGAASERLSDLLAGFQVVNNYSLSDWVLARFDRSNDALFASGLSRVRLDAALAATNVFGGVILILLPIGVGSYMVYHGQSTFGTLIAMIQASGPLQFLVYSLGGTISRLQSGLAAGARITAVLDQAPEPPAYGPAPAATTPIPRLPAGVESAPAVGFDAVHFAATTEEEILAASPSPIEAWQRVPAFVGPHRRGQEHPVQAAVGPGYPVAQGAIAVEGRR